MVRCCIEGMSPRNIVLLSISVVLAITLIFLLWFNSVTRDIMETHEEIDELLDKMDSTNAAFRPFHDSVEQAWDQNKVDSGWQQYGLPGEMTTPIKSESEKDVWLDSAYR